MVALNLSTPIAGKLSLHHLQAWLWLFVLSKWFPTICDAFCFTVWILSLKGVLLLALRSVEWLSKARAEVDARGLVFPLFSIWRMSTKLTEKLCVASLKCSLLGWPIFCPIRLPRTGCCLTGVQNLAQALLCSGSFQHRTVTWVYWPTVASSWDSLGLTVFILLLFGGVLYWRFDPVLSKPQSSCGVCTSSFCSGLERRAIHCIPCAHKSSARICIPCTHKSSARITLRQML